MPYNPDFMRFKFDPEGFLKDHYTFLFQGFVGQVLRWKTEGLYTIDIVFKGTQILRFLPRKDGLNTPFGLNEVYLPSRNSTTAIKFSMVWDESLILYKFQCDTSILTVWPNSSIHLWHWEMCQTIKKVWWNKELRWWQWWEHLQNPYLKGIIHKKPTNQSNS